jgi:hypothetical protein
MNIATRLKRLEIAFEGDAVSGAQATVEDGILDGDGRWVRVRERTFGLDTGQHPEYAAALDHAFGPAAARRSAPTASWRANWQNATKQSRSSGRTMRHSRPNASASPQQARSWRVIVIGSPFY